MKTRSAKSKGVRLQNLVRDMLRKLTGLGEGDIDGCPMGSNGTDVKLSPAAKKLIPYAIECKNQERISFWAWWEQCVKNSGDEEPILVIKSNRKKPTVTMTLEHFEELLKR